MIRGALFGIERRFSREEFPMSKAIIYSENSHATEVFSQILAGEGYGDIVAKDQIAFCGVDASAALQLVNAGSNFDQAVRLAEKLSACTSAAVILLADQEHCHARGEQIRSAGVILMEKPLSRQLFVQSVQDAQALYGRIRRMGDQLNETRLIARAKLILVEKQHMTEQQAHKHIEKEAMNRRITRLELANELISANAE